jgi:hypothetical protein
MNPDETLKLSGRSSVDDRYAEPCFIPFNHKRQKQNIKASITELILSFLARPCKNPLFARLVTK